MKIKEVLVGLMGLVLLLSLDASAQGDKNKKRQKKNRHLTDTLSYTHSYAGDVLEIEFIKGESFNHPTFVIWTENAEGKLLQTLFVTEYFGTGIFGNADAGNGTWKNTGGEALRPAALPYWTHKRNVVSRDSVLVPTPENPMSDAITGATPKNNFIFRTHLDPGKSDKIFVLLEINQTWDWNEFWTNNKYPNDTDYKSSSQPSVIYRAEVNLNDYDTKIQLEPVGHGHYSGNDGSLTEDLTTLTTALEIAKQINVTLYQPRQ